MLRPFMLRRTKEEVEKGMPPKLETTISCPLSEMQVIALFGTVAGGGRGVM